MARSKLGNLSQLLKQVYTIKCIKNYNTHGLDQTLILVRKIYAIDFDGTIVEDMFPKIGRPKRKVIRFIKSLIKQKQYVILWTCRKGVRLTEAVEFCKKRGIVFNAVNKNLKHIVKKYKHETRKVYADYYLDDKNITLEEI